MVDLKTIIPSLVFFLNIKESFSPREKGTRKI
jgi:hypothetical protein